MKKIILFIFAFLILSGRSYALESEKEEVSLIKCESATSMWVSINDKVHRIKLLSTDISDGKLNKEINDFACDIIKNAKSLKIERDVTDDSKLKYNEELVYLYVDDEMLQEILLKKGYAQVNYVYADYKYLNNFCELEKSAIEQKLGIWNYPDIKEEYCKSGIEIKNKDIKEEVVKTTEIKDNTYLKKMVLINSILVLFLIIFMKREKNE